MRQRSVQARKKPRRLLIPNVVRTVLMAYFCSTIVASFTVFPNGQLPTTSITRLGRYRQRAFIIPTVSYRASAVRAQRTGTTAQAGDTSAEPDQAEWKALLAALRMYKAAYGDLKVPQRFVVPSMLPWPSKCCAASSAYPCCACLLKLSHPSRHQRVLGASNWGRRLV